MNGVFLITHLKGKKKVYHWIALKMGYAERSGIGHPTNTAPLALLSRNLGHQLRAASNRFSIVPVFFLFVGPWE